MRSTNLKLKKVIDNFIGELIQKLITNLKDYLESITIAGSYGIKRISLQRPNVNILIFLKPHSQAHVILRIGEIIYQTSQNYLQYFSLKVDSFPFRLGLREGEKDLQLILSPRILFMDEKKDYPPFNIACNVLKGMREMRKVVYGSDPLENVNLEYSREDFLNWAYSDIGNLAKNMLILTPISYNLEKNKDLIVIESIGYGKMALTWGTELFLNDKDIKTNKHIELIKNKENMVKFYKLINRELGKATEIILDARNKVYAYKNSKRKTEELFNASIYAINKIFKEVKRRQRKQI